MADCFINGHVYGSAEKCIFCGAESCTTQPLMELREIALGALNDPIDPKTPVHERDLVVQAEVLLKLIDHYIDSDRQRMQADADRAARLRALGTLPKQQEHDRTDPTNWIGRQP